MNTFNNRFSILFLLMAFGAFSNVSLASSNNTSSDKTTSSNTTTASSTATTVPSTTTPTTTSVSSTAAGPTTFGVITLPSNNTSQPTTVLTDATGQSYTVVDPTPAQVALAATTATSSTPKATTTSPVPTLTAATTPNSANMTAGVILLSPNNPSSQTNMTSVKDATGNTYSIIGATAAQKASTILAAATPSAVAALAQNVSSAEQRLNHIQELANETSSDITFFKEKLGKLLKQLEKAEKQAANAAAKAIKDALEHATDALSSQSAVSASGRKTLNELRSASTKATETAAALDNEQTATAEQKAKAHKFASELTASYEAMSQADTAYNATLSPVQSAVLKTTKAKEQAEPYIQAHEALQNAQEVTKKALDKAMHASATAPKSKYNLTHKDSVQNGMIDCMSRSKEDCKHRDQHCTWLNEVVGCTLRCNALQSKSICNTAGHGDLCTWGTHESKPFCFHK